MKNLTCLLMIALYCSSCSPGNQSDAGIAEIENTTSDANEVKPSGEAAIYHEYEGELEGNIALELKFHQADELVRGELVYKKIGRPIAVTGTVDENGYYRIYEFGKDGMITGILSGNFGSDAKNLSWFSPESRKRLKMELELKTRKANDFDFGHNDMVGEYRYEFGKDGSLGNLTVEKITKDSIHFDLICLTGAPGRNMATNEDAVMAIDGNRVSVDFREADFYDCAYDILFYKDFARIRYVDDRRDCGFGHNADVEGIFMKVE